MDPHTRARAEARLAEAAEAEGIADPRPSYREALRQLKHERPDAFKGAVRHYEEQVLPSLIDRSPLPVWVEYGRYLASLTAPGSAMRIDGLGRATPWTVSAAAGLVLFMPDDGAANVMVLCEPLELSDAQQATLTLLVDRKLSAQV
ncbi:MAG: hypothetical protein KFH98_02240 [Gemmatimonadetes bacterium]|nr:hypothetical protein [Gemmatimonadota bacterium]